MESLYTGDIHLMNQEAMAVVEILLPYLLPIGLVLFTLSLWRYYVDSLRDPRSSLPLPPGSVGAPFVGETLSMAFKGFNFYREKRQKYGRVYKTHVLGKPTIRVWGQENIRKVLKNEETLVTMSWPTSVKEIMGKGALAQTTRRLHNQRRAGILRAFTNSAINGYSEGLEKIIAVQIQKWCETGKVMALQETKHLCFEATARMLLGSDFTREQMISMEANMAVMLDNFFTLPVDIPGTGFHKAMKARTVLLQDLTDIIGDLNQGKDGVDAVSILKSQVIDGALTMEDLKDSVIEMLFSGYNGLSSFCCSTFIELARHPEVIDNLALELKQSDLLEQGSLEPEKLAKLTYLQQVIKEMLRFAPPFGGGFRQVLKTFELEGYQIPAGWTVLYSIRDNHEVEENFEHASEFNPDRWSNGKQSDAYLPFGGNGIRSCVGEKFIHLFAQLFICQLVRGSQWELADQNTAYSHFPTQVPTNGLPLNFSRSLRKAC